MPRLVLVCAVVAHGLAALVLLVLAALLILDPARLQPLWATGASRDLAVLAGVLALGLGAGSGLMLLLHGRRPQLASLWLLPLVTLPVQLALALLADASAGWLWLLAVLAVAATGLGLACQLLARVLRRRVSPPGLADFYRDAVADGKILTDPEQERVVQRLQVLADEWLAFEAGKADPLRLTPKVPKGVYVWGRPGRGKSFLVDGLINRLPARRKQRIHFHDLMRLVRRELHQASGRRNPLAVAARAIAGHDTLLVVDELHLTDVDNAVVWARLQEWWLRHRVSLCITSNHPPEELLGDNPGRQDVLDEAVAAIQRDLTVLHLGGERDYRHLKLSGADMFHFPLSDATTSRFHALFDLLADGEQLDPVLQVNDRLLAAQRHAPGVVWFTWQELCAMPRSHLDFLQLVQDYNTILLSDVPVMDGQREDPARRFAWLVELVYDARKRLIVSAAVGPEDLFAGDLAPGPDSRHGHDFERVVSRLLEMQSTEYDYALGGRRS